ncbi:MAG: hypothetical protein JO174_07740 [Herbaspirillum sp.]|nr:hypothetical protein [Herbaspirillum sp.]
MFGISSLGWVHTIGSLPAIPLAIYMLARHGRIRPRSVPGALYFVSMLVGALTVFLVAKRPESNFIAMLTLVFLLLGVGMSFASSWLGRLAAYVETIALSVTVFLLLVPAVSETLRRVPDGHPFVTDLKSPVLLGAQGALLLALLAGVTAQVIRLRRQGRSQPGRVA